MRQWTFEFVAGRFDGYSHVADPGQLGPFGKPPQELHLWEDEKTITVQEEDEEGRPIPAEAERYCLREVHRRQMRARYAPEGITPKEQTLRDELDAAVPELAAA